MATFYHVSTDVLTPYQVLEPGRFGLGIRRINAPGGERLQDNPAMVLLWEATLETARRFVAPTAPSRSNCVFVSPTLIDALSFRDRFRQGGRIYEVMCPDSTPTHNGNYDAVTDPPRNGTHVLDFMPDYAISYWRDKPTGIVEVLIGGPVTVVRLVE
jgi:hypothetical protein